VSELTTFLQLGLRHILDVRGLDHVVFLVALAAVYRMSDWRQTVWVVTAFTVGHSITLAAAVLGYLPLSQPLVEFLIPVTIVATCIENIVVRNRMQARPGRSYRPVFAVVFGLVHGAGFGGYLKSLFLDDVGIPLLGFNIGIELGQIAALVLIFLTMRVLDSMFRLLPGRMDAAAAMNVRVVAVSAVVMLIAAKWASERTPW
jgi:hydrogenase/urease accessory protein HupE